MRTCHWRKLGRRASGYTEARKPAARNRSVHRLAKGHDVAARTDLCVGTEVMFLISFIRVVLRRVSNLGLALLILLLQNSVLHGELSAASLTNLAVQVVDSMTHRPLSSVHAILSPLSLSVQSDANGWILFRALPPGTYDLRIFSRANEELTSRSVEIGEHDVVSFTLKVSPTFTISDAVIVHGIRPKQADTRIITKEEIASTKAPSIASVLSTQSGVVIREGRNGDAFISINGSEPRHVKVLLNGLPLGANADGSLNLSQIPVKSVQEIRVVRGAAAQSAGPGAIGGLVDIRTIVQGLFSEPQASAQSRFGSWGRTTHQTHAELGIAAERISALFDWEQRQQRDDFEFQYTAQPSPKTYTGTRQNNDALSRVVAGSIRYKSISAAHSDYSAQRGLPDRASAPNLSARSFDHRRISTVNWAQPFSERISTRAGVSYQQNLTRAVDSITVPSALRFDSRYDNSIWQGSGECDVQLFPGTTIALSITGSHESVEHRDKIRPGVSLGTARREAAALTISGTQNLTLPRVFYLSELSLTGSLRHDRIASYSTRNDSALSTEVDGITPVVSMSLSKPGQFSPYASLSIGENWSSPSLTSLFWQRDARSEGNPSLRPEQATSRQLTLGCNWHSPAIEIEIASHWHQADYTDLVIWRPDFQGVWRPVNLASSQISGRSDQISVGLFEKRLRLGYTNDLLNPRNRTRGIDYDKNLTFRPQYTSRFQSAFSLSWLHLQLSHDLVARRFANESNTRWYDPYEVTDLKGGVTIGKELVSLMLSTTITNLFDSHYAQIAHYPMPGRGWEVTAQLTFDWSRQKTNKTTTR